MRRILNKFNWFLIDAILKICFQFYDCESSISTTLYHHKDRYVPAKNWRHIPSDSKENSVQYLRQMLFSIINRLIFWLISRFNTLTKGFNSNLIYDFYCFGQVIEFRSNLEFLLFLSYCSGYQPFFHMNSTLISRFVNFNSMKLLSSCFCTQAVWYNVCAKT